MAIKSAQQHLVDLYNAKNNFTGDKALLVTDVVFDTPVEALKDDEVNRNTETMMHAIDISEHFTGKVKLSYRRVMIGFEGTEVIDGNVSDWESNEDVLAFLNARLQLQYPDDAFLEGDLIIHRNPTAESGYYEVEIIINDHLKFLDATVVYAVNQVKTDLSTTNGELDGFSQ